MVPLDVESDAGLGGAAERFGPDAVLLCGFSHDEAALARAALNELGADFVRVELLTTRRVECSLLEALQETDDADQPLAMGVPRTCFLSGMTAAEAVSVMDALDEALATPFATAAAVPLSINKPMRSLLAEVQGDHEAVQQQQQA